MSHKVSRAMFAFSAFLFLSIPVLAHHAFSAVFDGQKELAVTGKLVRIDWVNPHAYFYVDAKDPKGHLEAWSFECFSPGGLRQRGLTRATMVSEIGQTVTISGYRAKDNTQTLGWVYKFKFPDKEVVISGGKLGADGIPKE